MGKLVVAVLPVVNAYTVYQKCDKAVVMAARSAHTLIAGQAGKQLQILSLAVSSQSEVDICLYSDSDVLFEFPLIANAVIVRQSSDYDWPLFALETGADLMWSFSAASTAVTYCIQYRYVCAT